MTELNEAVKFASIDARITKCPFQDPEPPEDTSEEDDDYAWDDSKTMAAAQENSASKLGTNVKNGSPGTPGTWNVLGGDPPRYMASQIDTARDPSKPKVEVQSKEYPYTVAAHHLIPGNGSLYESQLYKCYMKKGGKMEVDKPKKMTFTVSRNIGYNVNGSHNGVWLPGSYAIRENVHPSKVTWSMLIADPSHKDWCYEYMAAVAKKTGAQFHDAHVDYYTNVQKLLNQISVKLVKHQQVCNDCQSKTSVPPPYRIKAKLYKLSQFLRKKCLSKPRTWKKPWLTSDQVRDDILNVPAQKKKFISDYDAAS